MKTTTDSAEPLRTIESLFNEYDYGLSDQKQNFVKQNFAAMSVVELAKMAYDKTHLDDRSEEVKQIKRFIIKLKREHLPIELDGAQRQMIRDLAATNEKPLEIAKRVFKNNSLVPLSKEAKTVDKYMKCVLKINPDLVNDKTESYSVPKSLTTLIRRVNEAKPELSLSEEKLTGAHKKHLEQLRSLLSNPRFIATMNAIRSNSEKDLFEFTFIEGVFGKDLNSEEINMYISLCSDYVLLKQIKEQQDLLNDELRSSLEDEDKTLKMSLSDAFGKKSTEYNDCANRIKRLQESLSGSRSKRIENQLALASSLVGFVEAWKSEDERQRSIIVARAIQKEVGKELDKIESASEWKARILGISKEELIHG